MTKLISLDVTFVMIHSFNLQVPIKHHAQWTGMSAFIRRLVYTLAILYFSKLLHLLSTTSSFTTITTKARVLGLHGVH